ncbi:hypothetical protein FGO68_gene13090 [Halteria grandinella]|uniref:Uncharacterized protein n=1 Tax=Halteria grandinella TaxID=5974 RepID=A0A8J8SXR1_HALGN|nr:hypothetical protein FGO68_gene13090 [Halteria grandinella]
MGLTNTALKEHQEKHAEAKLEDKFPQKGGAGKAKDEEDKEDYDFENAQIEDLANMLGGGPLKDSSQPVDQQKMQEILKKKIALIDRELSKMEPTSLISTGKADLLSSQKRSFSKDHKQESQPEDKDDDERKPVFIKRRDRKTLEKKVNARQEQGSSSSGSRQRKTTEAAVTAMKGLLSFQDDDDQM